ncbi:MAG: hypothetical protein HQL31_04265, partial [Planctomycetes bacterium]|nr:hypothetical protein [Planctomycetota bacterium]
ESLITLSRESGALHLRVKFVLGRVKVDTTSFEFSILPTPSKPRPEGWRNYAITPDWSYYWDCNWYSQIWEKVEGKGRPVMKWDDPPQGLIEKVREAKVLGNGRGVGLPYLNPQYTCSPHPCPWDVNDQSPVKSLFDSDWANMPSRYGWLKPVKSYRDWVGSVLSFYMREWGLAGYYVDEPYIAANFDLNLLSGSGWFDREGNLRGSYHVMDMREYVKQMYIISYKYGRTGRPFTMVHASSFGMSPFWTSFAGSVCFGEGSWGVRKAGESILDVVPLENLQLYNGDAFGYIGTFFGMYLQQQKDSPLCAKSYENTMGALALHDMVPNGTDIYRGANVVLPIEIVKKDFGIGTKDVEFIGYWYADVPVESSDKYVKASTYTKPGRSLIVLVNTDVRKPHASTISIHEKKLGLYGGCKVLDAVSAVELQSTDGIIEIQLEEREVKYLHVVPNE